MSLRMSSGIGFCITSPYFGAFFAMCLSLVIIIGMFMSMAVAIM